MKFYLTRWELKKSIGSSQMAYLTGDMLPSTSSAELHAAFGLDPFLTPHLQYAVVPE
jgi:hypothetical protein